MTSLISNNELAAFKRKIWRHYSKNRRDFPWRQTADPYSILVSEIMLQQTQAARVVDKYLQFLKTFPTVLTLAQADNRVLLAVWQGLGYNRRALQLKRLARVVVDDFAGKIPSETTSLLHLPGIGPATAAAVRAFAFDLPGVYLDTNVRRVYIDSFFPDQESVHDQEIIPLIEATISKKRAREWGWALLDYGAMLGRSAKENPNRRSRHYAKQSAFKGSSRQIRGAILRELVNRDATQSELRSALALHGLDFQPAIMERLIAEGYIEKQGSLLRIKR